MLARLLLTVTLLIISATSWANGILTSIKPIQLITNELTQGIETPDVLLGTNASPHDYALRPSDVKRIRQASLVIWFGLDLEPFLTKILSEQSNVLTLSDIPNLKLRKFGPEEHDEHEEGHHHHGEHDPHFWLGVKQAATVAQAITNKLIAMDSAHSQQYRTNLKQFLLSLKQTDKDIQAQLKPVQKIPYYVFHDGYAYFEQHFGLNNQGHFTVSPERKPGAKTLIKIRTLLTENKIQCVFAEPQFQPAVIKSVVRGTKATIGILDPLATDIPVTSGGYFQFLRHLSQSYYDCLSQ
ncbi:zinc ABC transporter substrate-binding protein ZnuA [Vibrio nitrifigilis]|uniref:High-affinity zinc uptake system protein ZnuA n=1 Tax=Vibrio nitrifigilis TaxID=2789781 RepID=A0ABS0GAU5_9VIBR|nr:zinc ABC transporter substrate-binding protein ZnuA [Vibrio nitrifigilis]MBF8999536.1 zinc ABC transporter substrate-binding protein ZnuA [Vibrio nitrifigilis]